MRKLAVLLVILALSLCACGIAKQVCSNQAVADQVKAKAQAILTGASITLNTLNAELAVAQDDAIIAALQLAILGVKGTITMAYRLIYEVACPQLRDMNLLEAEADSSAISAKVALAKAKAVRK